MKQQQATTVASASANGGIIELIPSKPTIRVRRHFTKGSVVVRTVLRTGSGEHVLDTRIETVWRDNSGCVVRGGQPTHRSSVERKNGLPAQKRLESAYWKIARAMGEVR